MLTCVLRRLCLLQPTRSSLKDMYRTRTRASWREPGLASNWKTADFQRIVHFKTRFHPLAFLVSINTEAADLLPSSHDPVPPASKHYPEVISSNETQRFQDHFNSIQMPHSPERGYRQSHFQSRPTMAFETSCNQAGRSRTRACHWLETKVSLWMAPLGSDTQGRAEHELSWDSGTWTLSRSSIGTFSRSSETKN